MEQDSAKVVEWGWHEFMNSASFILNYKLFELDGSPVSVAKLLTGIALLIGGYLVSKKAQSAFDRRILGRLHIDPSLRFTFSSLFFYFFFFLVTLFTLRALNVPITIFTVLGGAFAVGIGFGSQNLVNNFISGILVMMERPVRIGDSIEVDGITGVVQTIGIRSTHVRVATNAIVIIPNTTMIEKNLTNWSLAQTVQCKVTIGVDYVSDIDKVKDLLLASVGRVTEILPAPPPAVLFKDFGDNALIFDLTFFTSTLNVGERRRLESDIRFLINRSFKDNGISFPFPQRDVHLDVRGPVRIEHLNSN